MSERDSSREHAQINHAVAAPNRFASFAVQSREGISPARPDSASPPDFAGALAESKRAGWDPREVWLTRVYKPREGRRTW